MALTSLKKTLAIGAVLLAGASGMAYAAGGNTGNYKMEHKHWHFNGAFGTYDKAAMQRGYQVYREVCSACHQLKHLSFRHLGDKGGPFYDSRYPNPNDNPLVKNFAADWMIEDVDSETGDVIERPGFPADKFPARYPNNAAAAASNGGAIPPDLSVMVKARNNGADYMYNLLVAYKKAEVPADVELLPGLHYNPVMDGGKIAMAAPLTDGIVEYSPTMIDDHGEMKEVPAPEATVEQMAADVTEFLAWSADPKLEQRKNTGLMTMVYLLILSLLLFVSYKRVWRNVEH